MGNDIVKIVGGIGVLIAIYLFIKNGDQTTKLITAIGNTSVKGISTLQGNYVPLS